MPKSKKRKKKTSRRNSRPGFNQATNHAANNQAKTGPQPAQAASNAIKSAEHLAAEQLAAKEPGNRKAWEDLAAIHMSSQNYSAAADAFAKITELADNEPSPLNDLATALAMADRLPEARRAQAGAIKIAPDNIKYRVNLAKIMIMQQDYFGARDLINQIMPQADGRRTDELRKLLAICDKVFDGITPLDDKPINTEEATRGASSATPPANPAPPEKAPVGQVMQKTDSPLNILFVQEAPCIRNYKTATALRNRGHRVTLGYTKALLSQMYKSLSDDVYNDCIRLNDDRHLWDISGNYDIVHCHNEPDVLTVAALAGSAPVIHDTHDLISLRAGGDHSLSFFEGMANRGAHGRVYTTPYQKDIAASLYGVSGPSLVFYNYTSAGDHPKRMLPKLSATDGQTHIVYEGGIGGNGHRDFISLFVNLARNGVHMHIYPVHFDPEMARYFQQVSKIHYHEPLSPKEVMEHMSQYDMGIIPFNIVKGNKQFLDSTIANKLFEYLAAGLPVFASPLQSYLDYFAENHVGKVFHNAGNILNSLDEMRQIAQTTDLRSYAKTYEGEVTRLEDFYRKVIEQYRQDQVAAEYVPVLERQSMGCAAPGW